MPKKNQQTQATVNPELSDEEIEEIMDDGDEITGEADEENAEIGEEVDDEAGEEKVAMTQAQKDEKIRGLVLQLDLAKKAKETSKQKTLRRQLRSLGFYMSKEKELALKIVLESSSTE